MVTSSPPHKQVHGLEKNKIGWAIWDYAGNFNLFDGEPGKRRPDAETLRALVLRP